MYRLRFYTGGLHNLEARDQVDKYLTTLYGGYTRIMTFGTWRDPDTGEVFREPSCVYEVLTETTYNIHWAADYLRLCFNQKSVLATTELIECLEVKQNG